MNRNLLYKNKAQQLVEFAIAVPILMMVLFIVIEVGTALNARATVGEGVKAALVKVNNLSSLDGDTATKTVFVENFIKNEMISYLIKHNIPNSNSIIVKVKTTSDYAVALVNYKYNPYFLLPGLFGGTFPSSIDFSSSQSLNPHIFLDNVLPGAGFSTQQLSKFHTDGGGNYLPTGALVDPDPYLYTLASGIYEVTGNNEHTAILLHFYGGIGTHPNLEYDYARLVSWNGVDLLPSNLRINLKTGTLEVRSPYYNPGGWFDTEIPYIWVVSALGINHLLYAKYNSFEMLLADNSSLYYRFRFNTTDPLYNRNIRFCGTTGSSGLCDGDQRGAATVNERALRMNPRLGVVGASVDTGDNSFIIGTMEPALTPTDPTHPFQHVNSFYFTHTDNRAGNHPGIGTPLMEWDSANWEAKNFITISAPRVFGLDMGVNDMEDEIYHEDITDATKNPFHQIYQYRFWLGEWNDPSPGIYMGPAALADDIYLDTIEIGIPPGTFKYVADIVDVYTDSDGDGIPDAWDGDPAYFDANVNGVIDGNELALIDRDLDSCNDGMGNPFRFDPDPGVCVDFPDVINNGDVINGHTVNTGTDMTVFNVSVGKKYYKHTPYTISGALEAKAPGTNIPAENSSEFYIYDPPGAGKAVYFEDGGVYYRKHPSWWDSGFLGCPNPLDWCFSFDCVEARRTVKANFIHGHTTGAGPDDLELDPSEEFQFLFNNDIFSPNSKAYRTPTALW